MKRRGFFGAAAAAIGGALGWKRNEPPRLVVTEADNESGCVTLGIAPGDYVFRQGEYPGPSRGPVAWIPLEEVELD